MNLIPEWVLESDALQRVVQFDVDTQIIGVELQAIAGTNAGFFIDIHGQRRDGARGVKAPMPVREGCVSKFTGGAAGSTMVVAGSDMLFPVKCNIMHSCPDDAKRQVESFRWISCTTQRSIDAL